jgi:hypothetical protein
VHFEVPKWLSLGLIVVIFAIAFVMARLEGPVEATPLDEKVEEILETTPIVSTEEDVPGRPDTADRTRPG